MEATDTLPTCDGNKTALTARVTASAQLWMNERGFKPVETEVGVAPGWLADLAGVAVLTRTEAIGLKLLGPRPRYVFVPGQFYDDSLQKAWNVAYESLPWPLTALVEVKTGRGDFRGDRKWTAERPTHLCYVATPPDLIKPDEVPDGWGWLVCSEKAPARQARPATLTPQTDRQSLIVVHAIGERRDNVTRHARLREAQKRFTAQQADERAANRMSGVLLAAADVLHGRRTLEDACRWHGLKLRSWQLKTLADDLNAILPARPVPHTQESE